MIPNLVERVKRDIRVPRVGGGDPTSQEKAKRTIECSPRRRG